MDYSMKVNFVDLAQQYKHLELYELNNLIKSGSFVGGVQLEEFEYNLAKYCGTKFAVGVGSGTDALLLSLLALGIGKGDEVLVPANTFIASALAVSHVGAKPIFVDVDSETYNLDVNDAESKVTPNTIAVMPVHLYGNPCNMIKVMAFAETYNLYVVEDCAQSIGATFNGIKTGAFGNIGAFSFYPTKNLGGLGQGGAVVTDDEKIAGTIRSFGNVGRKKGSWGEHDLLGYNSRLDTINAWFLNCGLKDLDENNLRRIEIAEIYLDYFSDFNLVKTPTVTDSSKHVYHLYELNVLDTDVRDKLLDYLSKNCNIGVGLHYAIPCHKQLFYIDRHGDSNLPVSEKLSNTLISLPMHPFLTDQEIKYVCDEIKGFLNNGT